MYAGFNRNIYLVICHQTEDFNPMELACRKAARKLIFEYLDDTKGYGWWGKNENKEFYSNMSAEDNPWNWIRVFNDAPKRLNVPGDHAGKWECSYLEYLYPGSIKLERLSESDDWFTETAAQMDVAIGEKMMQLTVDGIIEAIQKGLNSL
jgi:creatinine amidohydrolase/Fe(II)-dependent formamide hydrolase-like protein